MASHLMRWLDNRPHVDGSGLQSLIRGGFGNGKDGEDRFDATVGLLGMIDVVDGRRTEGVPEADDVKTWEGWILGQRA
ncbi:hypothetical protein JS562_04460 [Agrobacterium sp. S2]|nr:hypothetical protein [Agrobacterium sp. S2]